MCTHLTKCVSCLRGQVFFVVTLFRNVLTTDLNIKLISLPTLRLFFILFFLFLVKLLWAFVIVVEKLRLVNVVNVAVDLLVNKLFIMYTAGRYSWLL